MVFAKPAALRHASEAAGEQGPSAGQEAQSVAKGRERPRAPNWTCESTPFRDMRRPGGLSRLAPYWNFPELSKPCAFCSSSLPSMMNSLSPPAGEEFIAAVMTLLALTEGAQAGVRADASLCRLAASPTSANRACRLAGAHGRQRFLSVASADAARSIGARGQARDATALSIFGAAAACARALGAPEAVGRAVAVSVPARPHAANHHPENGLLVVKGRGERSSHTHDAHRDEHRPT